MKIIKHWREKFVELFPDADAILTEEELADRLEGCDLEGLRVNFLDDLKPHDLRHHFASVYASAGGDIYKLQKLLGHSSIKTTERYAHLFEGELEKASNKVGNVLGRALGIEEE